MSAERLCHCLVIIFLDLSIPLLVALLINLHLPKCKFKYGFCLPNNKFITKEVKHTMNLVNVRLGFGDENHACDNITPNFEGKILHTFIWSLK